MARAPEGSHFFGQALHLTSRLLDHVERLDNGALHAADDIAVVLRAFLDQGRGNDVMRRLFWEGKCEPPTVALSRPPMRQTHFSVGSVPTSEGAVKDGATVLPVTQLGSRQALVIRVNKEEHRYTWAGFLNDYANKWGGAHLDRSVPNRLPIVDVYAAGGFNLSAHLLRCLGVEVWWAAQWGLHVLLQGRDSIPHEGSRATGGSVLAAPGGCTEKPSDRMEAGRLQWLNYETDLTSFLLYSSVPCDVRVSVGGGHTQTLRLAEVGDTRHPPSLKEVRGHMEAPPDASDFSLGRVMRVAAFVKPPPDIAG